jgi:hypothetical protein
MSITVLPSYHHPDHHPHPRIVSLSATQVFRVSTRSQQVSALQLIHNNGELQIGHMLNYEVEQR